MPLLMLLDSVIVIFSIYISYFLINPQAGLIAPNVLLLSSFIILVSHHLFAFIYRLYHKAWEYASVGELASIAKSVTLSIGMAGVAQAIASGHVYIRVLFVTWMLHMLLIGASRFSWRMFRDYYMKPKMNKQKALIVGAGAAGTIVARQLLNSKESDLKPVAFVDDDPRKQHLDMYDLEVCGGIKDITQIVYEKEITTIIIAIPSLPKNELRRIYEICSETKVNVQITPSIEDVMTGKLSVSSLRNVEVEDLLGREPVELDMNRISKSITGKTVLVTGAGGSIGSEICRQIAEFTPKQLILLGRGEFSVYTIDQELTPKYKEHFDITRVIADVQDRNRIFEVMETYRPDVVYHAAAHKHVPLMEENPYEAVKNNVFGTKNVAEAAETFGVKSFVLVSTDKAVNPPNVMGATKRVAEMVIQNMAKGSNTNFVAVRFGNVLGSRGSVIPLFKKQIEAGGPVTVTHKDMTRYFMTIPEASRLVIQAGTLARGGEVFVLDMGEPVKISDLAKNLITLSGYTVEEIGITYSGIRPGEKLYEELLNDNEIQDKKVFPKIHIGKAEPMAIDELHELLARLPNYDTNELKEELIAVANRKYGECKQINHTTVS